MERAKFKKVAELPPPQRIKSPSGDEMVILPVKVYDAMVEALGGRREDAADIAAADEIMARIEGGQEATFPLDVVKKMRSQNRVAVLRDYWGMTQKHLAELAGTDPMYISQIETGRARGGLDVMRNIGAQGGSRYSDPAAQAHRRAHRNRQAQAQRVWTVQARKEGLASSLADPADIDLARDRLKDWRADVP
jgi:transcriptional regulator with XRE-family HTH domain